MPSPQISRIAVVICAALLILGPVVVAATWAAYLTDSRIESQGSRADAVILNKDVVRSADGDTDYSVAYQFRLPTGQPVNAERIVPRTVWSNLHPGTKIVIRYAPDEPGRNFPEGGGVTSVLAPILASFVFGGLAILGGVLLYGIYRARVGREA
ncbi:MAG TPA: DUF3592 domain-containing protein [Fluviicoccus sp.]|nr:DUF3592 domain-containing protein [Fluviicoccus sp.]